MSTTLNKNCILVGTLDYFCLVCEKYLKCDRDADEHIKNTVHQEQLDSIQYVEEFKSDKIKKIKNKYFCELCNKLLYVLPRVILHVRELTHIEKHCNLLQRHGNYIIAFKNVVISNQSWNGLNGNTCIVCNIEYDTENENVHENQSTHILNVIQMQVQFDENQNIYRMIDDVSFQCLTCNMLCALKSLTSHFSEGEHKKLYQDCCDAYSMIPVNKQTDEVVEFKKAPQEQDAVYDTGVQNKGQFQEANDPEYIIKETSKKGPLTKNDPAINEIINGNDPYYTNKVKNMKDIHCGDTVNTTKNTDCKDEVNSVIDTKHENTVNGTINANCKKEVNSLIDTNIKNTVNNKIEANGKDTVNRISNKTCKDKLKENYTTLEHVYENEENKICKALLCKDYVTSTESNEILCILCNLVMPRNINGHVESPHHQAMLRLHKNRLNKMDNNLIKEEKQEESDDILDKLIEFQEEAIHVNFESNTAYCKKCNTHIKFNIKSIKNHILDHNIKPESPTKSNDFDNLPNKKLDTSSVIQTVNDVVEDKNNMMPIGNKESDVVTQKTVSSNNKSSESEPPNEKEDTLKNGDTKSSSIMKAQVAKTKKTKAAVLCKTLFNDFLQSLVVVKYLMHQDLLINDKYCINITSFGFMQVVSGFKCLICEECLQRDQLQDHFNEQSHNEKVKMSLVIENDDTEFIREICSGFHCGYCNTLETSWDMMEGHLRTYMHKEAKASALWRRTIYQEKMQNCEENFDTLITDDIVIENICRFDRY